MDKGIQLLVRMNNIVYATPGLFNYSGMAYQSKSQSCSTSSKVSNLDSTLLVKGGLEARLFKTVSLENRQGKNNNHHYPHYYMNITIQKVYVPQLPNRSLTVHVYT